MRVAAIVVTWNSAEHLPACLAALQGQDHPDLTILVVDNASVDASVALVRAAAGRGAPAVRLIENATNRGFCGGVNDALSVLDDGVEAVLLVNPDVVADPDLVSRLVARLAADPRVGSVQPRLERPGPGGDRRPVIDTTGHVLTRARIVVNRGEGAVDRGQFDRGGRVFGTSGACVLHRRAMLADVAWRHLDRQVLTEDLVAYLDDVELDWRARCRGWDAVYEPTARGVHERRGARRDRGAHVEALNWSNHLLVVATCGWRPVRHLPLVAVTTLLKTLDLALRVPAAVPAACGRLRLLGAARRRGRELRVRARTAPEAVVAVWAEPFRWRAWVRTWWRRVRLRGDRPGARAR